MVDFISCIFEDVLRVEGAGMDRVGVDAAGERAVLGELELHSSDVVAVRGGVSAEGSPGVDSEYVVRVRDVASLSGIAVLAHE